MSTSRTNAAIGTNAKNEHISERTNKDSNNLVVRVDQDSDNNLQALFDSVLNPGESKRPLQVPFRMRKLPNSFFNPPAATTRSSSVTHSRANSADSAYDAGSQSNVSQTSPVVPPATVIQTSVAQTVNRMSVCHLRAHSSPALLQQNYNMHLGNLSENTTCVPDDVEADFNSSLVGVNSNVTPTDINTIDRLNQCASQDSQIPIQTFHMKQRSYDVVSPIQLQNELGALPPGWEQAKTNDGQIYYLNHNTKTTQWEDPRIQFKAQQQRSFQKLLTHNGNLRANKESFGLNDSFGPLPEGWEQALTDSGDIYFINHINRTTSWNDPRIPDFLQKSIKMQKSAVNWLEDSHEIEKEPDFFIPKLDQSGQSKQNSSLQMDPFLSVDNHARQESSDSGLSLSSNTFSVNQSEFMPQMEESMDCLSENGNLNDLSGIDCPDNLVSSLQLCPTYNSHHGK